LNQFTPAAIPVEPKIAIPNLAAKTTTPIVVIVVSIPVTSSIEISIFEHDIT
jgi:hypothetical protein